MKKTNIEHWQTHVYKTEYMSTKVNIKRREIHWNDNDEIDSGSIQDVLSILDMLEEIDPTKDVVIILNNCGGDPTASLAFIDRITKYKFKINVHGEGLIASAATILMMGTTGRKTMSKYAHMMFHQISDFTFGSVTHKDAKSRVKYIESLTVMILDLYTSNSNIKDAKHWEKEIMSSDTYYNAQQCLEFKIIDEKMKRYKEILSITGAILAILIALTQLVKEGHALRQGTLPSEVPDTVYVVHMGRAGSIEIPDSLVDNTPARMSSMK